VPKMQDYYNWLLLILVFSIFFIQGFRLADIRKKERRKRMEADS